MISPAKIFLFVLCFTAEVHVRAASDFKDRPAGCLKKTDACALQTLGSVFHLEQGDLEFHLGQKSLVLRQSPEELEFLNGSLWLQKYQTMTVKTVFGNVHAAQGPFWVLGDKEKIWVRNVNADLKLKLRDGREIELPVGFQIWLAGADEKGRSVTGIPEMIPVEEHLRLWAQMFPGDKKDFQEQVEAIKWTWGSLPERSTELYRSMNDYQLKLARQRKNLVQQRELAQQDEKKKIRELYEQKSFYR